MNRISYIPHIDGLRALAVLLVLWCHLQIAYFQGGYIGVDVFFVISGYLITGILLKEYRNTGSISLGRFYVRRFRRLLPSLLAVCAISYLVAFLIFTGEQFSETSRSIPGVLFSFSNISFWLNTGYFDLNASSKLFLHTWSLSVEEQFYIVWPLLLLCVASSRKVTLTTISLLCIFSLLLNYLIFDTQFFMSEIFDPAPLNRLRDAQNTAFYLTPFRIYELGIGGIVACSHSFWQNLDKKLSMPIRELIVSGALLTLLIASTTFSDVTRFPYFYAIVPCLATAMLIAFSSKSKISLLLLSNRLSVFIGKLSYSLYLVHWPIIVIYLDLNKGRISSDGMFLLSALSFIFAFFLHRYVEQPFRRANPERTASQQTQILVLFLLSMIALAVVAANQNAFFQNRIPIERFYPTNKEMRIEERETYCRSFNPEIDDNIFTCQNYRGKPRSIYIVGDSHGMHLVSGFSEAFPEHNIYVAYQSACVPQSGFLNYKRAYERSDLAELCVSRNRLFLKMADEIYDDDLLLLTSKKDANPELMAEINNHLVSQLRALGRNAFTLGDFISPGVAMGDCFSRPKLLLSDQVIGSVCKPDGMRVSMELEYSEIISQSTEKYIPVWPTQCPDGDCSFFTSSGRPTHRDDNHLSIEGSIHWISKIKERGLFDLMPTE